jgi:hypothetical protein
LGHSSEQPRFNTTKGRQTTPNQHPHCDGKSGCAFHGAKSSLHEILRQAQTLPDKVTSCASLFYVPCKILKHFPLVKTKKGPQRGNGKDANCMLLENF